MLCLLGASLAAEDAQFRQDCGELTRAPHRLAGTPEGKAAADFLAARLKEIGVDQVVTQQFPAAQTMVKRCELTPARGAAIPLIPMRPNGIMPPVTPPEGITGKLEYAGSGTIRDFDQAPPAGNIVILDYNSGIGWLRALRLGARAVIFAMKEQPHAGQAHYTEANANLPRFLYRGSAADLPTGEMATLYSEVVWQTVQGRNVFGFVKGAKPVFDEELGKEEAIVLAANLDSFGEAPRLTPGARGAANCAGLLKIAAALVQSRPRRNVLLAFLDNQARGHAGSSALYLALETDRKAATVEARQESHDEEQPFRRNLQQLLTLDFPLDLLQDLVSVVETGREAAAASVINNSFFADKSPADLRRHLAETKELHRDLLALLKPKAAHRAYSLGEQLQLLHAQAKKSRQGDAVAPALQARIDELTKQKSRWNDFRRALSQGDVAQIRQHFPAEAVAVLDEVRQDIDKRLVERWQTKLRLDADTKLRDLVGNGRINFHLAFLLGDRTARWGLAIGGQSRLRNREDKPGLYTKVQNAFADAFAALGRDGLAPAHFEIASANLMLQPSHVLHGAPFLVHNGELAGRFGIYNLALTTVQEDLAREGTPADTVANLDLARLEQQFAEAAVLLGKLASEPSLSFSSSIKKNKFYKIPSFQGKHVDGPLVRGTTRGSSVPSKSIAGATIQLRHWPVAGQYQFRADKVYAYDDFQVLRSNQNGAYSLGPGENPEGGRYYRGFAALFDARGQVEYASSLSTERGVHVGLVMHHCRHRALPLPPLVEARPVKVLDGETNGTLFAEKSYFQTYDGVVSWFCERKVKSVKLFGLQSCVALVNGPEGVLAPPPEPGAGEEEAGHPETGTGLSMLEPPPQPPQSARLAGADLWRLNEARMALLRRRSLAESSLEELHGRAEDLLLAASKTNSAAEAEALATSAFLGQRKVYTKVRGTLDDLVHAVLILLALSVPFAFALERLLVGSTSVYRQIGYFAGFFVFTFLLLYLTHPAFAIAKTPIIIFLGFAIVLLSGLVIVIIMRKFEVELKVLQGLESTVHAADVSRFGTVMAAMSMGISSMRRRPLRTGLTAVTIILLTFTILCFASFGTKTGIVRIFQRPAPGYSGVLVRNVNWGALDPGLLDLVAGRWGKRAVLAPRLWVTPETESKDGLLLSLADGAEPLALRGAVGFARQEFEQRQDLLQLFGARHDFDRSVWLTSPVAGHLGLAEGDEVLVNGQQLVLAGIIDSASLAGVSDLDESEIVPIDFVEMGPVRKELGRQMAAEGDTVESTSWETLPLDSVVFTSAAAARRMGGRLRLISVYTRKLEEAEEIGEELARSLLLPVTATRVEGVYRHVLGTTIRASGAKDLFFPILLGGLIIFGTMLGSVADREREIYTFSALGLAPQHVAGLFFAEAMTYSVLGGMGGYLLAQASMKVLTLLTTMGALQRMPEINYSSTNAIVTILVVMATVLVSAIYPAMKASRSANPGIMRSWRLPAPEGDVFNLVFPFTVSDYDITGVVSFLKEHFDSYSDTGLGSFMARDTRLVEDEDHGLGLEARLALAPFDLGVTQAFALRSRPSEIAGIDEVAIRLERVSGQPKDWQRLNKVLLDDLRRQFLIWRALPQETMEMYRERTLVELGRTKPTEPEAT